MKKWYRNFIFIISIVIGLSVAVVMMNQTSVKVAYNNPVTQEDYEYLKECTEKVAKNVFIEKEEKNVRAHKDFDNKNLYVTCELIEQDTVKCKVNAEYPIVYDEDILIEKENIQIIGKIDFNNVTYHEEALVKPLISQVMARCLVSCIIVGLINVVFYYCPKELKDVLVSKKK